jgi:cell division protein FtsN
VAAKRSKPRSQARRGNESRIPGWAWLLAGVLLGLAIAAFVLLREGWDGRATGPVPDPQAKPPQTSAEPAVPVAQPEPPKRPRYDFYTLLREKETAISDRELADRARAEAAAAEAAAAAPATTQTPPPAASLESLQLQAGAFRDAGDAEALKARLALMGQIARVQSDTINGSVWHRVRLGPYSSLREVEAVKRELTGNGVDAIAVRESTQ